ncbi:methylated-DNA--[protein]-cysteine S-methyltransferase, partial [Klebsiella pneumoniae]
MGLVSLNLAGTPFQLQVWEALLTIPEGQLRTYQDIAEQIGKPKAVRAVATAIGQNPIAYLIPCHRSSIRFVVKSSLTGLTPFKHTQHPLPTRG